MTFRRYLFSVWMLVTSSVGYCDSFFPSLDRWKTAADKAAHDPITWAPLAGAAIILAAGSDRNISDWATDKRPVFGSHAVADDLTRTLQLIAVGTLLFSPQQPVEEDGWVEEKGVRLAELYLAAGLANGTTGMLKNRVQRYRPYDPDGNASYSFPSGHATEAFAFAAITRRNMDDYDMSDTAHSAWNIGVTIMAGGVAWSRVETHDHYPSDVLAGAAVGNFVASTVYNAFVGESTRNNMSVGVAPAHGGVVLNLAWHF